MIPSVVEERALKDLQSPDTSESAGPGIKAQKLKRDEGDCRLLLVIQILHDHIYQNQVV